MSLPPKRKISRAEQNVWQLHDAKARFSQLIKQAEQEGIQKITRNKEEVAVVMSQKQYEELIQPKSTILSVFKRAPFPELDLEIERSKDLPREIEL